MVASLTCYFYPPKDSLELHFVETGSVLLYRSSDLPAPLTEFTFKSYVKVNGLELYIQLKEGSLKGKKSWGINMRKQHIKRRAGEYFSSTPVYSIANTQNVCLFRNGINPFIDTKF